MRTLSAFQPAVGGEIEIMGKKLTDYTDKQLATVIGVVLTEKCSLRNMTVEDWWVWGAVLIPVSGEI